MNVNGGYEKFCGGQLWNASLTWHTPNPTLSNCSLWTVVAWLPCLYMLLFAPVYFFCYLRQIKFRRDYKDTKISPLFVLKMIVSLGLTITSFSCFVYCCVIYATNGGIPEVALVTPPIITMVFIISTFIIIKENDKRLVTSGFHSFFYFILSITSALFGYSVVWQYLFEWDTNIKERFLVVAYATFYLLFTVQIAAMLILFCVPDKVAVQILKRDNPNVCPELTMAFLGRIVYMWIFRLLIKGYKKTLTLVDLWTQFDGQDATLNRETFFEHWNKKRSLLRVLAKMFGPKLLVSHASMACSIAAMFLVPFLLSVFIEFFDDPAMEHWKGVLCSLSFFVNYVFESIAWQQMMYVGYDVGSRVKATLTSVTFHKILLLDTSSSEADETQDATDNDAAGYRDTLKLREDVNSRKKKTKKSVFPATPGEAVNLISTDIHNLGEATAQLHLLWAIPAETVMVLALLWWLLSVSVGVMIIIVVIALIAIFVTSRFLKSLQLSQLRHKDGRMQVFTEVINGIKLLKLYTWEEAFEEKVQNNRVAELRSLRRFFYVNSINIFSSLLVPNLTTFVTFSIYSWFIGPLTAKKAFTSMSLFNILQYQLLLLPVISSHFVKARVSLKRVEAFLQLPELHTYVESSQASPIGLEPAIQISGGTFSWDATCEPTLKNITLTMNHKSLTAVVGLVGSGKSSILSAILGEIRKLEGSVKVQGQVAYVSQQAWIQNATLRDNILFGMPYQENKYNRIVEACALKRDLDILTAGDLTIIGEKGINLSGGQKQRVSLARSLYQDCDIYLLDDPLSAVDSHVAKHIFSHAIGPAGYLKNKTRVLVTHAVRFLPYTDHVIVLDDGSIAEQGTYHDLSLSGGRLTRFIENLESAPDDPPGVKGVEVPIILGRKSSKSSYGVKYKAGQLGLEGLDMTSIRSRSLASSAEAQGAFEDEIQEEADLGSQIISPESVGAVKFGAYKFYASLLGYLTLALIFLFFVVFKSFAVMSNVWISYWTDDRAIHESFNATGWNNGSGKLYYDKQKHYISFYGMFVAGHALFLICYCITSIEGNTRASRQTHSSMLRRIIRAPMSFFESTPTGRILNRFSRDLDVLDSGLPDILHQWLAVFTSLVSTVIIITMSIPMFLVVAIVLVIVFLLLQHLYLPTVRQLKWEESNSRSPIYALVCEALTGLDTIRAYQRQAMFERRFDRLVNNNTILIFAANAAERWLGFHLEMMGAVTTFAASMFSLFNRGTLSGSTVGMFMASSIQDSFSLCYLVRLNSSLETNMVSMERLNEYFNVEVEIDPDSEIEIRSSKNKSNRICRLKMEQRPIRKGKIEFVDYSMRYRPDLDYSLNNINVLIDPGQKVGIIGRTGAGKSSLISALFRFNLNVEGFILIDDLDTSSLPLKVLRSSMTVLPQDPIIFSGTVRMNLDPLSAHSDLEIWNALQQVKMEHPVKALPGSLDFVCQTDGLNFSVGQRQLLCLGRTLLHKTSILILDEATAAVDLETDKVIQETIRTQFSDCTVLTIAHRINTILSCDRIMLLDNGRVKEYNSPNSIEALKGDINTSEIDRF